MSAVNVKQALPALDPVRRELLGRAAADADRQIADARQEAQRILSGARDQAARLTETAAAAGQAAAAVVASQRRTALERALRGEVLAAQRDIYQQWRRRGAEAVLRLHDDPDYPRWAAALRAAAAKTLGADAAISEQPEGGVVAETGDRRADLSLAGIAERALDATVPQLGELWS